MTPSIWLSEEWFNPDNVVGFAIPFYLVHPRLTRLERRLMLEVKGVAEKESLRILRHETGHAIDEAFQLYRTTEYAAVFGSPRRRYPTSYAVVPHSRQHVVHLNAWYAQSHPVEDFAETFATWLRPKRLWRRQYRDWPALRKLEAVDDWMTECRSSTPSSPLAPAEDELSDNERTLAEHYEEKRAFYGVGATTKFDSELLRIFARPQGVSTTIPRPVSDQCLAHDPLTVARRARQSTGRARLYRRPGSASAHPPRTGTQFEACSFDPRHD